MALERIKSERAIKALKPGDGRVNDGGGLYLVPFAWEQSHYWRMDYTHQGRRRTLSLGVWPETGLEQAKRHKGVGADSILTPKGSILGGIQQFRTV